VRLLRKRHANESFRNIINRIIHHVEIEVIRTDWKLYALGGTRLTTEELFYGKPKSIPTTIFVRSDKGSPISFYLQEMVEVFRDDVFGPIIELCNEQDLWLEDQRF
jgi:hypothetical protein